VRKPDFCLTARTRSARRFEVLTPEAAHERPFSFPGLIGRLSPQPGEHHANQTSSYNSARFPRSGAGAPCPGRCERLVTSISPTLREDIGLPHGGRRPRANAPPGGNPLLAHLKHRAQAWGRVFFAFPRPVLLRLTGAGTGRASGVQRSDWPMAHAGMTVGLFGGSFDPPHAGHVHVSREALKRLASTASGGWSAPATR
jgi:hypothetical protein